MRKGENITKRKDGRWEARVMCGYDEKHKVRYRYLYGKTYAEAKAKKELAVAELMQKKQPVSHNNLTVNQLLEEFLLHKEALVKESTLANYRNLIRIHITEMLGNMRLKQLNAEMLEQFGRQLINSGAKSGKGLSAKTTRDILSVLRSACKYAVSRHYISEEI